MRVAKRRKLAAHERAIELHERLGHPEWAEAARNHARHARELLEYALRELQD
jgi:hypothetical protein